MRPNSSGGPSYLSRSGRIVQAFTVSVGKRSGDAGRSLNDAILVTTSAVVERCAPGALEITTWNLTERGPEPSDEAFTIVVP